MKHRGISFWYGKFEQGHWVVSLPGRWLFHFYDWSEPRRKHFYLLRRPDHRHINEPWPEFRRWPL